LAKAEIFAGICGFTTTVETHMNDSHCDLAIDSDCKAVQRLATELTQVEPFHEITFRGEGPRTLRLAAKHCSHAACPVPTGIIKAVEIEAGLALPADVSIKLSRADE
jgi:hypothetical protein